MFIIISLSLSLSLSPSLFFLLSAHEHTQKAIVVAVVVVVVVVVVVLYYLLLFISDMSERNFLAMPTGSPMYAWERMEFWCYWKLGLKINFWAWKDFLHLLLL